MPMQQLVACGLERLACRPGPARCGSVAASPRARPTQEPFQSRRPLLVAIAFGWARFEVPYRGERAGGWT
jgi:hypothetical protein